jgi:Na+/melibiose symporter-like transporter
VLGTVALLIVPWTRTFASLFVCVSGVAIFRVTGVLDAQALDFLGTKHRGLYGTIRMWTAISWGIGAVLMGWAIDRLAFKYNFIFYGICMGVMVLVIEFGFPNRSKSEQALIDQGTQSESNRRRLPQFKELRKAMCRFPVVFWLLEVAIIGAAVSISDSFLFVFMQNELRASTKLCGFTAGITVLFEIPVFLFSQPLLKRVGHDGLFLVATAVYTIRVVGYTFLTLSTVTWILLLEVLHGLTFACMWIASVDFSAAIAPEEWSTTVQSILSAVFTCIGAGLGPIVGGRVMQRFGASYLYRGAGLMVGSTMVIHLLILVFFRQGLSQHIVKLQQEKRDDEGRNREEPIL